MVVSLNKEVRLFSTQSGLRAWSGTSLTFSHVCLWDTDAEARGQTVKRMLENARWGSRVPAAQPVATMCIGCMEQG